MPSEHNTAQEAETADNEKAQEDNPMNWIWNTFFANRAAAWTALSTIVLCVFSGLLYKVSEQANETSVVSQRAFLSPSGPGYGPVVEGKKLKGFNFFYTIGNSGTTPAKAVTLEIAKASIGISPQKGFTFDDLPQTEKISLVIGPKGNFQATPIFVSVDELETISQGKRVVIWGWMTYRDIFPQTPVRLSEFCIEINSVTWPRPSHTDPSGKVEMAWPPCHTHNCYDEDCEDYPRRVM